MHSNFYYSPLLGYYLADGNGTLVNDGKGSLNFP
jgi:hypothetical protein